MELPVVGDVKEYLTDTTVPAIGVATGVIGAEWLVGALSKAFNVQNSFVNMIVKALGGSACYTYGIARDNLFLRSVGVGFVVSILLDIGRMLGVVAAKRGIKIPAIKELVSFKQPIPQKNVVFATKPQVAQVTPVKKEEVTFAGVV